MSPTFHWNIAIQTLTRNTSLIKSTAKLWIVYTPPPPPPIMDDGDIMTGCCPSIARTPKQTPQFDTRSEINPSHTLAKNEIMKTFKSAQNIGNRASKCIWHCFSCEMGYLSTRLRSFTRLRLVKDFGDLCRDKPISHSK